MSNATGIELRYVGGTSAKFWRCLVVPGVETTAVLTNYGRIGSARGQITVHHFVSTAGAQAEAMKLVHSKTRKGYRVFRPVTEFPIDPSLADRACSTGSTGHGGWDADVSRDLVDAWETFDRLTANDPGWTPASVVAKFPDNPFIRSLVAFDQRCDETVLVTLAEDEDDRVRQAATTRIVQATLTNL